EGERTRSEARAAAQDLVAQAKAYAEQTRRAATEQAATLRSAAVKESDEKRTTTEREVQAERTVLHEEHARRMQDTDTAHLRTRELAVQAAAEEEERCERVLERIKD